jgi:hypothetical protein
LQGVNLVHRTIDRHLECHDIRLTYPLFVFPRWRYFGIDSLTAVVEECARWLINTIQGRSGVIAQLAQHGIPLHRQDARGLLREQGVLLNNELPQAAVPRFNAHEDAMLRIQDLARSHKPLGAQAWHGDAKYARDLSRHEKPNMAMTNTTNASLEGLSKKALLLDVTSAEDI